MFSRYVVIFLSILIVLNASEFNKFKNINLKSSKNPIKIYSDTNSSSKLRAIMDTSNGVDILGCNNLWCRLKYEDGYILFKDLKVPKKVDSKIKIIDDYTKALLLYKDKNYLKAYKLFLELSSKNLSDPNINFYLGRSAFELKKYSEAIVAFENVLFQKPDSTRVKFEMARAYFLNHQYNASKNMFLKVLDDKNSSDKLNDIAKKYLKAIALKEQKHFINGVVIAGVGYDSNINNSSKYRVFNNVYIEDIDSYII